MKKKSSKALLSAALVAAGITGSFAQGSDNGKACGCPTPVSGRPAVSIESVFDTNADGNQDVAVAVLTCANRWTLNSKFYVGAGQILIIEPGTVVQAEANTGAGLTGEAIIVSRGGQINAAGTESCPIILTVEGDNLTGVVSGQANNFPQQLWGGLVLLGRAHNNLQSQCNVTGQNQVAAKGLGVIEGFTTPEPRAFYGANLTGAVVPGPSSGVVETFNDNDNSGILRYVSVRHGGATVGTANELNGITFGSVGRGTIVENCEVVCNSDDGFEFFGGSVNIKRCAVWFNDDDGFDYDQAYNGKMQFLFGLQSATTTTSVDNGFECDTDDNSCVTTNNTPDSISTPTILNATLVGRNNSGDYGIEAKEFTGGRFFNNLFMNFNGGVRISAGRTNEDTYENWVDSLFHLRNNTWVNATSAMLIAGQTATAADTARFNGAGNVNAGATLAGTDFTLAFTPTSNQATAISNDIDVIPNPQLSTTFTSTDGFFDYAPYRGAFPSTGQNWLSSWSFGAYLQMANGLAPCPNDINGDGTVNISDFNSVLGAFNTNCN